MRMYRMFDTKGHREQWIKKIDWSDYEKYLREGEQEEN